MNIKQLNTDFAIPGQLKFIEGEGKLIQAHISNKFGKAVVSTYAGQVLGFMPAGEDHDLLFISKAAHYQEGKAVKGGAPVCWPWFGPDPEAGGRGDHGFARNRQWQVTSTETLADDRSRIVLGLNSSESTLKIWPFAFALRIEITLGQTLDIDLITVNLDKRAMKITQALHTYLNVGDVSKTQVMGLEGSNYIDKLDSEASKTQHGPIQIEAEVDRIYTGVQSDIVVDDPVLGRSIRIASRGSKSAVVWNPWRKKAAAMSDFGNDEYKVMLCVETTNAGPDVVHLAPGESYSLGARYQIERH